MLLPLLLFELLPDVERDTEDDDVREPLLDAPLLTRLLFTPEDVAPPVLIVVLALPPLL